jgi:hypothetical protein
MNKVDCGWASSSGVNASVLPSPATVERSQGATADFIVTMIESRIFGSRPIALSSSAASIPDFSASRSMAFIQQGWSSSTGLPFSSRSASIRDTAARVQAMPRQLVARSNAASGAVETFSQNGSPPPLFDPPPAPAAPACMRTEARSSASSSVRMRAVGSTTTLRTPSGRTSSGTSPERSRT